MAWSERFHRGVMAGMDILARRLRRRLDHLKLSQAEVEQRTGLHHETLRSLLDGTAPSLPQPDRLVSLCRVLGVTPAQLLGFDALPGDTDARPADPREAKAEEVMAGGLEALDDARLRFAADLLDLIHDHRGAFTCG